MLQVPITLLENPEYKTGTQHQITVVITARNSEDDSTNAIFPHSEVEQVNPFCK